MRDWIKRLLGKEGIEDSVETNARLDEVENQITHLEKRVKYLRHIRAERRLYEKRQRGTTE